VPDLPLRGSVAQFRRSRWRWARCQVPPDTEVNPQGGDVVVIRPGDTIYTPPGEWHSPGAAPDHFECHLVTWDVPGAGQGPESEWGEHVTDDGYNGR
jgi:hypothetical protein